MRVSKGEDYIRDYAMDLTDSVRMENQFLNQLQYYVVITLQEEKVERSPAKRTAYKRWQAFWHSDLAHLCAKSDELQLEW